MSAKRLVLNLGLYFGTGAPFWIGFQSRQNIARVERERGAEIAGRVRPVVAA